jgi:hypothetical protein
MEPAAPVAQAPAAPAAAPEAQALPLVGDTAAPAAPEAPQPERTFSQKELDEILEKRLGKERRKREDIERRLRITEELHLKGRDTTQPQPKAEQPQQAEKEPQRSDYPDMPYEDFVLLKAEWRAERKAEAKFAERDKKQQEEAQRKKADETAAEFRKRVKESAKGLDDFDEVIAEATRDPSQPVARLYADALEAADAPARVLYELAKNTDEAERIAALPLARQAREIWLLDSKLKQQPQAPQRSSAPAPIDPLGGKSRAATDEITGNETGDEYKRKRDAQQRKAMGR